MSSDAASRDTQFYASQSHVAVSPNATPQSADASDEAAMATREEYPKKLGARSTPTKNSKLRWSNRNGSPWSSRRYPKRG